MCSRFLGPREGLGEGGKPQLLLIQAWGFDMHPKLTVKYLKKSEVFKGRYAGLTRSSLIGWENNRTNNKTMDPSPENNRAA